MGKGRDKGGEGAKADPNAWMVTFGDLLMLLLTFFVLLLTMKSMDAGKAKEMFENYVGEAGTRDFIQTRGGSASEGGAIYRKTEMISGIKMFKKKLDLLDNIDRAKTKDLEFNKLADIVEVLEDHRGVVVSLESDHLFPVGEADIREDRLFILDEIAHLIKFFLNDVLILGHTDNTPLSGGRYRSNWELSTYRALNVLNYLVDKHGLDPGRLAAGGYGSSMPRAPNDSDENRAKNRRVEFILKTQ